MGFGYRHGGFMDGFGGNGPGALGVVMFVVFWAAIALLVLLLVQHYRHSPRHLHDFGRGPAQGPATTTPTVSANPAIDILMERFAKGEVSEEEYTRRLTLLKSS